MSLLKGRPMQYQLSAQKLISSHHLLFAKCGFIGAGMCAGIGVPMEAVCKRQVEVVTAKSVYILPYKLLCNLIN